MARSTRPNTRTTGTLLIVALLGGTRPSSPVDVPGGGGTRSDCYAGFEVETDEGCPSVASPRRVEGTTSRDSCKFKVRLCTAIRVPGCRPARVLGFHPDPAPFPLPPRLASGRSCGNEATLEVHLGRKNKRGARKIGVVAVSDGHPKRDADALVLRCSKRVEAPSCGSVCAPPAPACSNVMADRCPANPAGGPNELELRLVNAGSDLDYGWTGTFHNFGFTGGSALKLCLTQCDTRTNPLCGACGPTGLGSINTATFGPPLPILAANVPLCVVNRFVPGEAVTGTADIEKGDLNITVGLLSDIFVTTPGEVCPRCTDGTCTSGANTGKTCTVDGTVTVAGRRRQELPPLARLSPVRGRVAVRGNRLRPSATHVREVRVQRSAAVCGPAGGPFHWRPRARQPVRRQLLQRALRGTRLHQHERRRAVHRRQRRCQRALLRGRHDEAVLPDRLRAGWIHGQYRAHRRSAPPDPWVARPHVPEERRRDTRRHLL